MIRIGVVGGTGYTGAELLRLLLAHPFVTVVVITSRAEVGVPISQLFPNLRGKSNLEFAEPDVGLLSECDLVFFATPNGTAMKMVPQLMRSGTKVIDLAADFRLKNEQQWQQWYGEPHACEEFLEQAIYGLPELNRAAITQAQLVANPGCYPTAVSLGFLPLLEQGIVDPNNLIADAKSGVSGAGRKAAVGALMCETSENFKAYAVPGHRHLPEISQTLTQIAQQAIQLTFVPHLTPMIRGIHATLYAHLRQTDVDIQGLFEQRYADEPFVDVLEAGAHPETRSVKGANDCRIAVHRPQQGDTVVVLSVIDNLVKGAAGQAIQNMNLMFGFPEVAGLEQIGLMP